MILLPLEQLLVEGLPKLGIPISDRIYGEDIIAAAESKDIPVISLDEERAANALEDLALDVVRNSSEPPLPYEDSSERAEKSIKAITDAPIGPILSELEAGREESSQLTPEEVIAYAGFLRDVAHDPKARECLSLLRDMSLLRGALPIDTVPFFKRVTALTNGILLEYSICVKDEYAQDRYRDIADQLITEKRLSCKFVEFKDKKGDCLGAIDLSSLEDGWKLSVSYDPEYALLLLQAIDEKTAQQRCDNLTQTLKAIDGKPYIPEQVYQAVVQIMKT